MSIDLVAFKSWLDAYGQAWENRDPEGAMALFTEDGTYQVTPFLEPMRGRKAIFKYWSEVARTEENIRFGYEILVVNPERNIARWSASFIRVPSGLQTKLDGIFLITLDCGRICLGTNRLSYAKHSPGVRKKMGRFALVA